MYHGTSKGKKAYAIVVGASFWSGVALCLRLFSSLVKLLRLTNGDKKPSMGFIYGELKQVREQVKTVFQNNEMSYRLIIVIIDSKAIGRPDRLHLAGYLLNPYYAYKDTSSFADPTLNDSLIQCVETFFPDDLDMQDQIMNEEGVSII